MELKNAEISETNVPNHKLLSYDMDLKWHIGASYSSYGWEMDLLVGKILTYTQIDVIGKAKIHGIRLRTPKDGRGYIIFNEANEPLSSSRGFCILYNGFGEAPGLDLRNAYAGDIKLGFSIDYGETGDYLFIHHRVSEILNLK